MSLPSLRPTAEQLEAARSVATRREPSPREYASLLAWQRHVQGIELHGAQALALDIYRAECDYVAAAQKLWDSDPIGSKSLAPLRDHLFYSHTFPTETNNKN